MLRGESRLRKEIFNHEGHEGARRKSGNKSARVRHDLSVADA